MQGSQIKVSVVIPCYYSEKMISEVVTLTREELIRGGYDYEFVLANDGSKDGTFRVIRELAEADPKVVGVDCGKNMGQHGAIMAALHHVQGDFVLLMDDDMQTHPSQCLILVDTLRDDPECDVVLGQWPETKQKLWRRLGSDFATWSMRVMTGRPKGVCLSNFFVMRRYVADEMVRYTGPYVYVQGLIARTTDRMKNVPVKHFKRAQGQSGYTFKTLVKLWSTVLGFSLAPLRVSAYVGAALGLVGLVAAVGVAINKILDPTMQAGWSSTVAILLLCSGLILLFLGLIGEYLGRLFITVNRAPQFVVRQTVDRRDAVVDAQSDEA